MNVPTTEEPVPLPWYVGMLPAGRLRYWITTVGRFSLVQVVAQLLMAACGLLIVRHLSKHEYALFIVANTMQGTIVNLSDAGAIMSLTAIGGKVWQDRYRLGQVINSTLGVRRRMTAAAMAVSTPLMVWVLLRNGAGLPYTLGLTAATLIGVYFMINASVYRCVLQLHSRVGRLQVLDLLLPILRTLLIAAFMLIFLDALVAIAVMTVVLPLQWRQVRKWAWEEIDADAPASTEDEAFIYSKIRNVLPDTIFYCVQGQMWIYILSVFGRSDHLAEVGALGRLSLLFNIVINVMHGILIPAFSRCRDARVLWRRYVQIIASFVLMGLGLVGIAWLIPGALLSLLGARYENLNNELVLAVGASALNATVAAMWLLNAARGWTDYLWVEIPLRLALQIGLYFVFDLSSVRGVLYFGLLSNLSPLLVTVLLARRGMRSEQKTQTA